MKTLKDIFYNKNDILVALAIVFIATLIIISRIDSILAYPSSLAADTGTSVDEPVVYSGDQSNTENNTDGTTTDQEANPQNPEDSNVSESNNTPENNNNSEGSNNVNTIIHIESGSTGEKIADVLMSKGLIKSKQEFYNAVSAAGADKKLKAGDFTIPSNSTPAEVIAIITR